MVYQIQDVLYVHEDFHLNFYNSFTKAGKHIISGIPKYH